MNLSVPLLLVFSAVFVKKPLEKNVVCEVTSSNHSMTFVDILHQTSRGNIKGQATL